MDVTLPVAIIFGVSSMGVSVGVAWGVVKVSTDKNTKEIKKLDRDTVKKSECDPTREGCQQLLLQKIAEVKEQNEKIDIKREHASEEHNKSLLKITNFMGRVEEYMRLSALNNQ